MAKESKNTDNVQIERPSPSTSGSNGEHSRDEVDVSDIMETDQTSGPGPQSRRCLTVEDLKQGQEEQRSFFEEYDEVGDGKKEIRLATPPKDTPCILCPDTAYSLDARIIYPKDAEPILTWGNAAKAVKPECGRASRIELYALRDGQLFMWLIKRPPQYDRDASRYTPLRDLYRSNRGRWFMFRWEQFTPCVEYVSEKAIATVALPPAEELPFPTCPMVDVLNDHFPMIVLDPNDSAIALYV